MKDIYLVACISNSLPERVNNAKTAIGLQEDITLKEAKAIIESVQDSIKNNSYAQRNYRAAVAQGTPPPRQVRQVQPRPHSVRPWPNARPPSSGRRGPPAGSSNLQCFRCGEMGHFASKCTKVPATYKCDTAGGITSRSCADSSRHQVGRL